MLMVSLLGQMAGVFAQEKGSRKRIELDVSISPRVNTILNQGEVITADLAVRYKWFSHLSVGLGVNPTFIEHGIDEIVYAPLHLSLRYDMGTNERLSPYLLLNAGGSFVQLDVDPEFQGRFAVGACYNVSERCALFSEVGISYITTGTLWSPLAFGVRF